MNWPIRTIWNEKPPVLPGYLGRAVLFLELFLATALALLWLGDKSLWMDEATSIVVARDWANIWPVMLRYSANMWLYYTLLSFWLNLGESEFIVRSLSVIFAVATVPVTYALGKRLFNARVGMLAGLLLTLNAFFIRYAQEARGYTLLIFLAALSSYFFVRGVERASRKHWGGYVISIILAMYTHFFGALVLVAHITSLVFRRQRKISWKGLVIFGVAIVLLLLPLALFQPLGIGQPIWIRQPGVNDIGRLFVALAGTSRKLLGMYLVLCFVALGFAVTGALRTRSFVKIWPYAFLVTWLLGPIAAAFVASFLLRPVFVFRYLILCLPPFVLLAAVGLSKISQRWLLGATLAIILILSGQRLFVWYTIYQKENWREATAFVLSEAQPGDAVYFYAFYVRKPFEYYLDRSDVPTEFLNLIEPDPGLELLEGLPDEHTRLWLVLSHDQIRHLEKDVQSRLIQNSLAGPYTVVQEQAFKGIRVLLYEKTPLE